MIVPRHGDVNPVLMAVLADEGTVLTERHGRRALDQVPARYRVYGDPDLVDDLWAAGVGEALCWRGVPVRWRPHPDPGDPEFRRRRGAVSVLRLPWPAEPALALDGLVRWRDWLLRHRAAPAGSLASTARVLLAGTVREPLWIGIGDPCPLRAVGGGRQQLFAPRGRYRGDLVHYDLQGAYTRILGAVPYGGWWVRMPETDWRLYGARERLCYVHAEVRVPAALAPVGPLPRYLRRPLRPSEQMRPDQESGRYPTGRILRGWWLADELAAAVEAGCRVRRVRELYVHMSAQRPFAPWLDAIEEGRALRGWPGDLSKAAGNALWGSFAPPDAPGLRTVESWSARGRRRRVRPTRAARGPLYDLALAEGVCARVRARLYAALREAPAPALLAAHTDGFWARRLARPPMGFRSKARASELDLLGPQTYRYRPAPLSYRRRPESQWPERVPDPVYVCAGIPARHAPAVFSALWAQLIESGDVLLVEAAA